MNDCLRVSFLLGVILSGCTTINNKVRQTTLSPKVDVTPIGTKVDQSLTIILGSQIEDNAAAPEVCKVQKFRESLENSLIKAMSVQFAAISTSPVGVQNHGLELLVVDARIPESHQALKPGAGPAIMSFHVVLRHNGKNIDEYQDITPSPPPTTRSVGVIDFNWRCSLLTEYYEKNIGSFVKQVQERLFNNEKLEPFWRSLRDD